MFEAFLKTIETSTGALTTLGHVIHRIPMTIIAYTFVLDVSLTQETELKENPTKGTHKVH